MPANTRDRATLDEATIRATYARQDVPLASHWPLFGRWSANSQYGHVLQWADSQEDAEALAIAYYLPRLNLIEQ